MALPNNPEELTFHILRDGSLKSPFVGLYCTQKWIVEFPGRCVFYSLAERLCCCAELLNHLMPNDHYMGRTAQLTSRCCMLYIYSTNIRTVYFKHTA